MSPLRSLPILKKSLPFKETRRKDERIAIYIAQFIDAQSGKSPDRNGRRGFPAKKQAQAEPVRLKGKELVAGK